MTGRRRPSQRDVSSISGTTRPKSRMYTGEVGCAVCATIGGGSPVTKATTTCSPSINPSPRPITNRKRATPATRARRERLSATTPRSSRMSISANVNAESASSVRYIGNKRLQP